MTRQQYRAITNSKAFKDFLIVTEDYTPKYPERFIKKFQLQLGTRFAPESAVKAILSRVLNDQQ